MRVPLGGVPKNMRRALVGLALLVAAVSCGTPTNGTSLFISVAWDDSWPIAALKFTGTQNSTDAFPPSVLPDPPAGQLKGPQSVVILLKDSLGGQQVDLAVRGLTADGGVYASATDTVGVVTNVQESVSLTLVAGSGTGGGSAGGGSAGGGSATGGGMGGGSTSAGGGAAGGSGPVGGGSAMGGGSGQSDGGTGGGTAMPCACATGCCAPGLTTCERARGDYFTCGDAGTTCTSPCDSLLADHCTATGACMCGTNPACNPGTRCATVNGSGPSCICDTKSNCNGCCDGDNCRGPGTISGSKCGVAGEICDSCSGSSPMCTLGVCSGAIVVCLPSSGCESGKSCDPVGFPVCAFSSNNHCFGCDPAKSNSCGMDVCSCGGGSPCGGTDTTCTIQKDGGYACLPIVGGG